MGIPGPDDSKSHEFKRPVPSDFLQISEIRIPCNQVNGISIFKFQLYVRKGFREMLLEFHGWSVVETPGDIFHW